LRLRLARSRALSLPFFSSAARFLLDAFDVARSRLDREVAQAADSFGVTCPDPDDLAARAEIIHVFAQEYFRVCHVFPLRCVPT
jgi:hypothetical protein